MTLLQTKTIFFCAFLACCFIPLEAQIKKVEEKQKFNKGLFIALKNIHQSYQDAKFTNLIYQGSGFGFELGYSNGSGKRFWDIGLHFAYNQDKTSVGVPYHVNLFGMYYAYVRNIFHSKNKKLYIGGYWDILDFYQREAQTLEGARHLINNSSAFIVGSCVALKMFFIYDLGVDWQLRTSLNFQLFGMMKQSPSFANSPPQDVIESGNHDFQPDENPLFDNESPLGLFTYYFEPFYKYLKIKLNYEIVYKKHWMFFYRWIFRRSHKVSNYPLTQGVNALGFKYQF